MSTDGRDPKVEVSHKCIDVYCVFLFPVCHPRTTIPFMALKPPEQAEENGF